MPTTQSPQATLERVLLASILQYPATDLPPNLKRALDYAPEGWTSPECSGVAAAIKLARVADQPCSLVSIGRRLNAESALHLMQLANEDGSALPLELADVEAANFCEGAQSRRIAVTLGEAWQQAREHPESAPSIAAHAREALAQLEGASVSAQSLDTLLAQRRFKADVEPPALRPVYTLAGQPVSTPGNLTTISSAIKTGKSAVIGAMAASTMQHRHDADLLGFKSANPEGKALLWFDSEQSPDDFWHCVARAVRRAGLQQPPPWLRAFCLTGLGYQRSWECIKAATRVAATECHGIHSMLIDGVADLVADVNDAAESNGFVATLHDMAIERDCPIIGVIHLNPGTDKSRGHLGSQLERKAETNLTLEKDGQDVTVVYSTKNRRAGIPKATGPRFKFDVAAGMHLSTESGQTTKDRAEREALLAVAEDLFQERAAMRYSELATTIMERMRVKVAQAERKVADMRRLAIIKKSGANLYVLARPTA
jgi:hypothetical protein